MQCAQDAQPERPCTEYFPLFWMHIWYVVTLVEEIVQTFGDLVRAAMVRHYASFDLLAWVAIKTATIASERRMPGSSAKLVGYSLVEQDVAEPRARGYARSSAVHPIRPHGHHAH